MPLKKFIALAETMLVLSRAHKCPTKEGSSVVKKFLPKLWELTKYA